MHRDRYRVTKTRTHGKGEKRPEASGNAEHDAPARPQVSSQNLNTQNEGQTPRADAPLQGEATRHDNPQRDTSQDDPDLQDLRPIVQNYNLLRVLPAVEISSDPTLLIRNPREIGPRSDICARVPGWFNTGLHADLVAQELILDEPASIIAWANDPGLDVDSSEVMIVRTTQFSTSPLLPYLQHVLGQKGSKWLV
ncbi:hypothetical protein FPHYL_8035 [Fusarium phyllophilum]|uniref:Uncharacterized protein n=1 Tax=Fusarium phyllophilum TaxID=47803 RepID=A0A8H5JLE6_9HYPO|nr:hypothetical protein FPHYL_8035 [Fusarium phyllophilum]